MLIEKGIHVTFTSTKKQQEKAREYLIYISALRIPVKDVQYEPAKNHTARAEIVVTDSGKGLNKVRA